MYLKNVYQHLNKISIVNKKLLLCIITITTFYALNAQNVNIPDANFKAALLADSEINTNSDGEIQVSEATAFTGALAVPSLGISDLTGIEAFTNIYRLFCEGNLLTSLDVSANTKLEWLFCTDNQITSIDVSMLPKLHNFWCHNNLLTSLDVSANRDLETLRCENNQLTGLDMSVNSHLFYLSCEGNLLTSLDMSGNALLVALFCQNNQLTSLDVRAGRSDFFGDPLFQNFNATGNPNLFCIQVDDVTYSTNQWTDIDSWANFSKICNIYTPDNNFEQALINLGYDTILDDFVRINSVTSLDVSNLNISDLTGIEAFTRLIELDCSNNSLNTLEVNKNEALTKVWSQNNQLTSMHINNGNNTAISNADFNVTNNPNLDCITVDDAAWSTTNWTNIDVMGSFSESYCNNSCIVYIPDPNFKAYLLARTSINQNGDSEIQCYEASNFTGSMSFSESGISDITGIEAFPNIISLTCFGNQITNLDLSANTLLFYLSCSGNPLTTIDITECRDLEILQCANTSLTTLDVSRNLVLVNLDCFNNELTALDVTKHGLLIDVDCSNNSITFLDFSKNPQLAETYCSDNALTYLNRANGFIGTTSLEFDSRNNPDLYCITVDDVAYSTGEWILIDPQQGFDSDCECIISIPDPNFKAYLLQNTAINTFADSEIQCSEAAAFSGVFNISSLNISDLTGIEAFTALTGLQCGSNSLSTLDVTKNTALTALLCAFNDLETLDVSQNPNLVDLFCTFNSLSTLDVSQNPDLTRLWCQNNQLTSLYVANGNNTAIAFTDFNAINNPNLFCIQVDNAAWSANNWFDIPVASTFSEDCSATLSIGEFNLENISMYPNPTKKEFIIAGLQENTQLEIYNLNGQLVLKQSNYKGESIDVSNLASSVYFVKISNTKGTIVKRLVRE